MRLTKRNLIKTAAVGSALLGAVAVAAPASANSFGPTDYGTGGRAIVSYDDGSDQFCVTGAGHPLLPTNVRVYPETRSRGPEFNFNVRGSETKCVSLGRAFEDSYYYFKVGDASPVNFYSCPGRIPNHSPDDRGAAATSHPLPRLSSPRQHFCCRGLESMFTFLSGDLAGLVQIRLHAGGDPMRPSTPTLFAHEPQGIDPPTARMHSKVS